MVVEARPGANLTIAANFTAKADPDGYTLFYSPAFVFNPIFVKNNPVDALKAFETVSIVSSTEYMMFVTGKLPEVIAQHRKLFGVDPIGSTPEEGRRTVERELGAWGKLAKMANFQPQ